MNRFLLDTHVLLWALYEPSKLSDQAQDLLRDPGNARVVSAVTAWEISTKYRLGKLPMVGTLISDYEGYLRKFQATELPVTSAHSLRAGGFEMEHRDPFDRMLAAQSLLEGLPLVTTDPALTAFPIKTVW